MKHNLSTITVLLAFLSCAMLVPGAGAQEAIEKRPFPGEPAFARKAPDSACWSVSFAYQAQPQAQPGAPRKMPVRLLKVAILKAKDIYHIQKIFSDGSQREFWQTGKLFAIPQPAPRYFDLYEMDSTQEPEPESFTVESFCITDFPEMSWASAKNFVGIRQGAGGDDWLVYKAQSPHNIAWFDFGPAEVTLYVDLRTRLPLLAKSRDITITYQYTAPPTTPLKIPAELQKKIEKRDQFMKMMTTRTPDF